MSNAFIKGRDPTEIRTKWILETIRDTPISSYELMRLSGLNGLPYAPSTYKTDINLMVKKKLALRDHEGLFHIEPLGRQWLYARREVVES